jgi:nucleotide-binding universal stress UspA family protein
MARTWVCGIDFSELSDRVLDAAADELSHAGGGKLVIVHVLPTPTPPSYGFAIPAATTAVYERLHEEAVAQANETLDEKIQPLAEAHPDVDIEKVVRTGEPAEELLDVTQAAQAHRIIVGSVGKGRLERLLLGSVAERVLRLAEIPVLVVK